MSFYAPRGNQGDWGQNWQGQMPQNNYTRYVRPTPQYSAPRLPGKIINSMSDIRPDDVPGNGEVAFFPAYDYSCIIAKGWAQEGDRMDTVVYVPQKPEPKKEGTSEPSQESILLQNILARTEKLEEMLLATGLFEMKKQEPATEQKGEMVNENNGSNHNVSTRESGGTR